MEHNFIENELIIIPKATLDIFLKQSNPSELMALYTFYYYTAKWQGTNQPKCTTEYASKGLHWTRNKVVKVKKQLIDFGIIHDVKVIDEETKKIKGHYIKIDYIFKRETVQCIQNTPSGEKIHQASVFKTQGVESEETNALSSVSLNALSSVNYERKKEEKTQGNKTNKKNKSDNSNSYEKIINEFTDDELVKETIYDFIKMRTMAKVKTPDRALKIALNKLKKLAKDKATQIQILEQSILNNWKGIFPLTEKQSPRNNQGRSGFDEALDEIEAELNGSYNNLF